ncbi:glucose-1-phosphate cytidylyltransferase [Anaeromicrobium sediminis]|uniref:Glucose-1-phosphate cytidylyltransferase n=1 Tax=Anaeromicrobium sediminis TaxID=1478221 RepID=A0A267MM28_9FIRM|nr:glucose-1-phosphate cytidylyltransferase [Anaeromicrobium sediminis]PAB60649.1 glucose-1-phosphate cytidylyltransferase [Anaeromicrobium sediminis]
MKVVILCGGKGTRMREETEYRPKPLVNIGGKPIIWHIMKIYSYFGFNDFILCLGYKGEMIKQYFMGMYWKNNDFTINTSNNNLEYHYLEKEEWNITMVDTGSDTLTGGRIKKIKDYIKEDKFMLTYGDGLSNVNINMLIQHHNKKERLATLTGVHPTSPFGILKIENGIVTSFSEKPVLKDLINGGFMVLNKEIFNYFPENDCPFEKDPLKNLCKTNELAVYEHNGFWTSIDTFKDVQRVNKLCESGDTPWKVWI